MRSSPLTVPLITQIIADRNNGISARFDSYCTFYAE